MSEQTFTVVIINPNDEKNAYKAVRLPDDEKGNRVYKQIRFQSPLIWRVPETEVQKRFDEGKIKTFKEVTKEELQAMFRS